SDAPLRPRRPARSLSLRSRMIILSVQVALQDQRRRHHVDDLFSLRPPKTTLRQGLLRDFGGKPLIPQDDGTARRLFELPGEGAHTLGLGADRTVGPPRIAHHDAGNVVLVAQRDDAPYVRRPALAA